MNTEGRSRKACTPTEALIPYKTSTATQKLTGRLESRDVVDFLSTYTEHASVFHSRSHRCLEAFPTEIPCESIIGHQNSMHSQQFLVPFHAH